MAIFEVGRGMQRINADVRAGSLFIRSAVAAACCFVAGVFAPANKNGLATLTYPQLWHFASSSRGFENDVRRLIAMLEPIEVFREVEDDA